MSRSNVPADHGEVSTFAAPLKAMLTKRVAEYALCLLTSARNEKDYTGLRD